MTSARLYPTRNLITATLEPWSACAMDRGMWASSTPMTSWRTTRPCPEISISCAKRERFHWNGTTSWRRNVNWRRNILRCVPNGVLSKLSLIELSRNNKRSSRNFLRSRLNAFLKCVINKILWYWFGKVDGPPLNWGMLNGYILLLHGELGRWGRGGEEISWD